MPPADRVLTGGGSTNFGKKTSGSTDGVGLDPTCGGELSKRNRMTLRYDRLAPLHDRVSCPESHINAFEAQPRKKKKKKKSVIQHRDLLHNHRPIHPPVHPAGLYLFRA